MYICIYVYLCPATLIWDVYDGNSMCVIRAALKNKKLHVGFELLEESMQGSTEMYAS